MLHRGTVTLIGKLTPRHPHDANPRENPHSDACFRNGGSPPTSGAYAGRPDAGRRQIVEQFARAEPVLTMRRLFAPVVAATLLLGGTGSAQTPTPPASAPGPAPEGRVFCNQPVNFTVSPRENVPEPYRAFVGIFSDAAWNAQLCAALIVENVTNDGTATIA